MANQWLRLWIDLPNDPKFRTISRISGQSISSVIAVYIHMLCCAANATERGRTEGWCDEDIATALDIQIEQIVSIREAMQGRLLNNDYLTGWEKRQPVKEDGAAARAKLWRESKKQEKQQESPLDRTQPNATERNRTLEEIREEEIRLDKSKPSKKIEASRGSRLTSNWTAPDEFIEFCKSERPDLDPYALQNKFRDYWAALPGKNGLKTDWLATWRNFVRSERTQPQVRGSPYQTKQEKTQDWVDKLIGNNKNNGPPKLIDIN